MPPSSEQIFYLLQKLTLKDITDITFLTFILFFILLGLWESRFSRVFKGILVIILIFLVSQLLDLTLTKIFFQSFFNIFLITLVLIFQPEIRKILEKLGLIISPPSKLLNFKKELIIENIVNAIDFFSKNKIGAILVFERNDNLSYYLQDEVYLNSEISSPLLLTIFNKGSALHDGAVIIDKNKIKYAGAYLPSGIGSLNIDKRGTRHKAGTAITAETDAFSIIVSEETGEISLAEKGVLKTNLNINEIIEVLNNYYFPVNEDQRFKSVFINKFILKNLTKFLMFFLLSFLIIFTLWSFTNYDKTKIQRIVEIPIEFKNLDDNLNIEKPSALSVKLTVSGLKTDFKFFNPTQAKVLINLQDFEEGNYSLSLNKENIVDIPKSIEILNIEPKIIKFRLILKDKNI